MHLICPVCKSVLYKEGKTAVCENRHSFDYAKQGYLNLYLSGGKSHGDSKESIQARTRFLERDHYAFLKEKLKELTEQYPHDITVDLACGQSYYTSVLAGKEKYGFDLSKDALKYAARKDPATNYIVASIFDLPFQSSCADIVTTCFAPIAKDEIIRILKPGGIFISVTPAEDHLWQLKEALYDTPYLNTVDDIGFETEEIRIEEMMPLDHEALLDLFAMTPYYYHTSEKDRQKLANIEHLDVKASFIIRIAKK